MILHSDLNFGWPGGRVVWPVTNRRFAPVITHGGLGAVGKTRTVATAPFPSYLLLEAESSYDRQNPADALQGWDATQEVLAHQRVAAKTPGNGLQGWWEGVAMQSTVCETNGTYDRDKSFGTTGYGKQAAGASVIHGPATHAGVAGPPGREPIPAEIPPEWAHGPPARPERTSAASNYNQTTCCDRKCHSCVRPCQSI
jgi:hypothetical protein